MCLEESPVKNYFLAFVLAVLVVLSGVTLRQSVASTNSGHVGTDNLMAIGGSPVPPIPKTAAIGGSPVPPIPKREAIGGSPVPPIPK
jgi:hypothetical protein